MKINNGFFESDGAPFFIYSGEIHYFRISPDLWEKHLERAVEAGLNAVSTYIPWSWHEYEEGVFDFEGGRHPQKNLIAFLKKVRESGLKLIIRIGPFSNAELNGEGIPPWLIKDYPEIYSTGAGIVNLPHTVLISYINKTFRKYIMKWYDKVIPVIAPMQFENDGNVVLTQLCNEIGMIQWVNGMGDFSDNADFAYQLYLKDKYEDIERLIEAYPGIEYKSFKEIPQTLKRRSYGWQDFWDLADFYRNYFADYYDFLNKEAVKRGILTPVIANIPQFIDFDTRGRGLASPMTSSFYRYIPDKVSNIIFGGAYQMRRLDYENFHDATITTNIVKSLTAYKNPVLCAELQTGILRDKPRLYPSDVELNLKTSMASGVDGVNSYMFSGGENPDGIGMFGKSHSWQAPVSKDGEIDEKFKTLKEHGEFIKTFGSKIAATKPRFQTEFGLYTPYYGTEFLNKIDCDFLVYARDRFFFDGMGRFLNLTNISFSVRDIMMRELDPRDSSTLFVFSLSFMDRATQLKLVDYVKSGGRLFLFPELPENDLSGNKCTLLIDELDLVVVEKISSPIILFDEKECFSEGASTIISSEKMKVLATAEGNPCVISRNASKGKIVFFGVPMSHTFDYQADIINEIFIKELGVVQEVELNPRDIIGMLRTGPEGSFIFLNNYHQVDRKCGLKVEIPELDISFSKDDIQLSSRSAKVLPLNVKLEDDLLLNYSTVEILSYMKTRNTVLFNLKGCPGETAEISINFKGKLIIKRHDVSKKRETVKITI
ncbi:beta-galactosidase [Elusimicrobiota bacterium]